MKGIVLRPVGNSQFIGSDEVVCCKPTSPLMVEPDIQVTDQLLMKQLYHPDEQVSC